MKKTNSVFQVIIGIIVLLFAGFVYAWSVLSAPIAKEYSQWSASQLSLTFTLCMAFFCLGGMVAGFLSSKFSIKVRMIASAILFITGFFLTSKMNSLPLLYISYGVLCGAASGVSYNTVMSTVPRWYPDRQGLVSGYLLMGFGCSSLIIGSAFSALTPDTEGAWRTSVLVMGVIMAALIFICSFVLKVPDEKSPDGKKQDEPAFKDESADVPPLKMLASASFWLFFIWLVLLSSEGLQIIGQARIFVQDSSVSEVPLGTLSVLVGIISVCNGLGRVIFGMEFDKLGRKITMVSVSCCATVAILLILLATQTKSLVIIVISFILFGLSYGGGPVMSASFTKAYFGKKYYASNFSIMTLSLLVASFGSALITAIYDANGQKLSVILPIITGCLAATILIAFIVPKPKSYNH